MTSQSVCQSNHSSVCHTTNTTSPSVCQTYNSSVCYTIILTSLSICQLQDSPVCQPTHDVTRNTVCKAVCPLSVPSILPSAKFMVKTPTSIPVQKFLNTQYWENLFPSIHQWICLLIHQAIHPSPCHHLLKNHRKSLVIIGRNMW